MQLYLCESQLATFSKNLVHFLHKIYVTTKLAKLLQHKCFWGKIRGY